MAKACHENGVEVDDRVKDIFTHYRKTHNDGVFDVYTEEIRSFRSLGFLTGLPDNYARGRIIGDYRRLALYGIDRLIEAKQEDLKHLTGPMTEARIRLREEVAEQIKALKEMKVMGRILRTRPQPPRIQCPRSRSMGIHGLSGSCKRAGRRRNVLR